MWEYYQPSNRAFLLRIPAGIGALRFEWGRYCIMEDRGIFDIENIVAKWTIKLK